MANLRKPKLHLRNVVLRADDYVRSPHVYGALLDGSMTRCRIITDRIVETADEATCVACLQQYASSEESKTKGLA